MSSLLVTQEMYDAIEELYGSDGWHRLPLSRLAVVLIALLYIKLKAKGVL